MAAKIRVFVSFDYDHDFFVAKAMAQQLADPRSPFEVENWSMKEAAPTKTWAADARRRINRSDVVLVAVGPQTWRAQGVLEEVRLARQLRVPIRQVIAYKGSTPRPVPDAGRRYVWTWDNLLNILNVSRRRAA